MLASSVRAPHNEAIAAASAHAIRSGVQMTSHTELETPDPGPGAGQVLPVLPLRDVVVYPHMVTPLFVGRDKSMPALERAMEGERQILLVAPTSPDIDDPAVADLHQVGTLAGAQQVLTLPDEIGRASCRTRVCQ